MTQTASQPVDAIHFPRFLKTTKWESFRKSIYNPATGAFIGRTGKQWGVLFLFYTVFYIVLAGMWTACMQGLFSTISDTEPKWKLEDGLIGTNPGLNFRPNLQDTEDTPRISYDLRNSKSSQKWIDSVDKLLKPYKNQTGGNYQDCESSTLKEGNVCIFDLQLLDNCSKEENYAYKSNKPCIFLKLNKIFDWKPEVLTEITADTPEDLLARIRESNNGYVWVTCDGVNSGDKAKIQRFQYFPNTQGFPGYYYPYTNTKNYLSPLVAVQIEFIQGYNHSVVSIECRAWAKNIYYSNSPKERTGSVLFEISVDS